MVREVGEVWAAVADWWAFLRRGRSGEGKMPAVGIPCQARRGTKQRMRTPMPSAGFQERLFPPHWLFQISPTNHALLTRENEDRLFGASGTNYSVALSLA